MKSFQGLNSTPRDHFLLLCFSDGSREGYPFCWAAEGGLVITSAIAGRVRMYRAGHSLNSFESYEKLMSAFISSMETRAMKAECGCLEAEMARAGQSVCTLIALR